MAASLLSGSVASTGQKRSVYPFDADAVEALGHRWLRLLESGRAKNLTEVAEMEGVDRAYVSRMVNLTTLAPDIVAAILDESLPEHVTLFDLASGTPLLWDEQRALLCL